MEGGRRKFYYVLGWESLSVYSLGTDTVKASLSLGRAHIPTAHPHSQSSLWSQNSALPMLDRIRGDVDVVFFPPLAYFYSWKLRKQRG